MCFLALITFMCSTLQIDNKAGHIVLHVFMLLFSLAGEVCIVIIYRIKARLSGIRNLSTRSVNPLHSPHTSAMMFEVLLWILMCPPGVSSTARWGQALDAVIVLRSYVFVSYFSHFATRQAFKRAMAAICGYHYSTFDLVRNAFFSQNFLIALTGVVMAWLGLALLYSKVEVVSYSDALYFCMATIAMVGYGDVAPSTMIGRFTAFLAWCLGLMAVTWSIGRMHYLLRVGTAERTLHTLFRTNKLCAKVPSEAARTIQRAWKLYISKRDGRSSFSTQFNALLLSWQICTFRDLRREFFSNEMAFLRATSTFEDVVGALSRQASPRTTPAGTPRLKSASRRTFALFKTEKRKDSAQLRTPLVKPISFTAPLNLGSRPVAPDGPLVVPLKIRQAGDVDVVASTSVVSSPTGMSPRDTTAIAEVSSRLQHLDELINSLLQKAEKLVPGPLSATEVVS